MTAARRAFFGALVFVLGVLAGGTGVHVWHECRSRPDAAELPPRRLEATVYLPLNDNSGQPIPTPRWEEAVSRLVAEFGGATLGPKAHGFWRGADGQLQKEPVRLVVVSFEPGRLPAFRRMLHDLGRELGQEAVYVRFEEPRVELVPVK